MLKNRLLTTIFILFSILLIISFSIALPIYIRPFYYAHIDAYNLEETTGKSKAQIKEAYNEVLDYLTLPGKEFGTGGFEYSEDGKNHFADCKKLFNLNFSVFIISLSVIVALCFLNKKNYFSFSRPFGKHLSLTVGTVTILFIMLIGGACAIDFDTAFFVFHKIFFYGKYNWLFDPQTDPIINALPQEFFFNCGILIISSIIIISIILICFVFFKKK